MKIYKYYYTGLNEYENCNFDNYIMLQISDKISSALIDFYFKSSKIIIKIFITDIIKDIR